MSSRTVGATLVVVTAVLPLACRSESKTELDSFTERSSYAIGQNLGQSLRRDRVDVDVPSFLQGLSDALNEREGLLSQNEIVQTLTELSGRVEQSRDSVMRRLAETNRRDGEAFRARNRKEDGVVTTASGLQYQILTKGDGPVPGPTDSVAVNYRGLLIDSTEFRNSSRSGHPDTLAVSGMLPGWTEALQLMNVGSKYRFVLAPDLAYGARGNPPFVGPGATIILEVELLGIVR